MKIIATEEHMVTPEVAGAWGALGLAARDPGVAYHGVGEIETRLLDLAEGRIALMDEAGVDVQVLSLTTPALHDLGAESIDMARRTNDVLAAALRRHPDKFQAMATLPVAAPEAAAEELERCVTALGFSGAMLCGRVGARNLDHPDFAPVFEVAGRRRIPLLLHPRVAPDAVRTAWFSGLGDQVEAALAGYAVGWHLDAGFQFLRLLLSGTFDRYPDLPIILGHWGELVLYYVDRLRALDRIAGLQHPLETYLRRNVFLGASGMFSVEHLRRAIGIVGPERLLFSTDYPYQYRPGREARAFVETCGLTGEALEGFAHRNWQQLTDAILR
ncbi:amidohydrolase family protein [Acidimangrovimonas sediminis]|uniref:amidohydrolase family protein n=1 Tax=Acidimangrovimonas sediminis TaxID=2056283 RepID=UPI000C808F44|nr:amidohydrolase family protein [Acidimangrovimonas sediminis]